MDEATSALDALTERAVQECLEKQECTKIIVAHRIATLEKCDFILAIELGQKVEFDRREVLLSDPESYYREMYEASKMKMEEEATEDDK